jgi:hypothetical protein
MSPSASRCLTYLLLLVPPLVVSFYLLASFPPPPGPLPVPSYPGLASLPPDSRARQIYSEDWVEGGEGAYVDLPMGRVRAVLHPCHGPMLSGVADAVLARGARERQEGKFIDNTRSSILSHRYRRRLSSSMASRSPRSSGGRSSRHSLRRGIASCCMTYMGGDIPRPP